jgi:pimeloyl-ACP methyl ester carboxylesterase
LVIVCHHGHETTADKFAYIEVLDYLKTLGGVLLSTDGERPQDTPRATWVELWRRGLLGREIWIYGLSMGARTGLRTARLLQKETGRPVSRFIWESAPFGPKSIDWPLVKAPVLVRILRGGPVTRLVIEACIQAIGSDQDFLRAARRRPVYQFACANMVVTSPTSPGEFDSTDVLAIEAGDDPRVFPCFQQLAPCFRSARLVKLAHAGHCIPHPERIPGIQAWLEGS